MSTVFFFFVVVTLLFILGFSLEVVKIRKVYGHDRLQAVLSMAIFLTGITICVLGTYLVGAFLI